MLVPPDSSSAVVATISSKSVSIYNHFHARQANCGKITISEWMYPYFMHSFEGVSSPSGTKLPHKKLDNTLGYQPTIQWKLGVCISHGPESVPGRDGRTHRQTDRQNIYVLSAVPAGTAVVRKKFFEPVKIVCHIVYTSHILATGTVTYCSEFTDNKPSQITAMSMNKTLFPFLGSQISYFIKHVKCIVISVQIFTYLDECQRQIHCEIMIAWHNLTKNEMQIR